MTSFDLQSAVIRDDERVSRVASLVKGDVVYAEPVPFEQLEEARRALPAARGGSGRGGTFSLGSRQVFFEPVLQQSTPGPLADCRYLLVARPDPRKLIENDPVSLSRSLNRLPFEAILDFADRFRSVLVSNLAVLSRIPVEIPGPGMASSSLASVVLAILPEMLRAEGLAEAVDLELGSPSTPGRRYLEGWVDGTASHAGMMARLERSGLGAQTAAPVRLTPQVRAVPTRQLHITAGNSPVVPFLSFLRALLTRGASTIKVASEVLWVQAILAVALRAAGPEHPMTRHTSLVYWPGGDREIEDVLFSAGAYDRVVVWGSAETVRSVRARALHTKTITMAPRYGVSLIDLRGGARPEEAARAASVDTLIWDQKACTSSLVHYVAGSEESALAYCEQLRAALAHWDDRLPRPLPLAVQGQLRMLERTALRTARWFVNGKAPDLRSAVVFTREPFDLSLHPMSRFVVVRRVERLEDALPWIGPSVSTAGVFPDTALIEVRDLLATCGVSNVFPLGECERAWPGMPHDGMRVLSELVNWTSSGIQARN